ncbi:DUF2631 domain-containing protein [Actinomycetes bacterium M1A6_2h]
MADNKSPASIHDLTTAAEVPSAAWGWSGEAPRAFRAAGWVVAVMLLIMLIGNHVGKVEDLWLVGMAVVMVVALVLDIAKRRRKR